MGTQIFENANILVGSDLELIKGYLKVRDGKIEEIGEGNSPKSGLDLEGEFVLPPFVNGHTHIGDSVKTDLYQGRTQEEVVGGGGLKFDALEESSEVEKIEAIRDTLTTMEDSGVLAHCDFREGGTSGCKLADKSSNGPVTSIILSRPAEEQEVDDLLSFCDGLGVPSLGFLSEGFADDLIARVKKAGKLLSFHVSETKEAHERSLEETGSTEIERVLKYDPSILVHGTWATQGDLDLIDEKGVPLVLCPRANSLLSVGLPRINQVLEEGIDFWLGTDNVSVSPPDMLRELSYAWAVLRLQSADAGAEEARELLKAATVNPLNLLDLPFGPIEEGNRAAFIVLSGKSFERSVDPYVGIVNRTQSEDIIKVFYPQCEG